MINLMDFANLSGGLSSLSDIFTSNKKLTVQEDTLRLQRDMLQRQENVKDANQQAFANAVNNTSPTTQSIVKSISTRPRLYTSNQVNYSL